MCLHYHHLLPVPTLLVGSKEGKRLGQILFCYSKFRLYYGNGYFLIRQCNSSHLIERPLRVIHFSSTHSLHLCNLFLLQRLLFNFPCTL